jgi:chromosome segregation ATPase
MGDSNSIDVLRLARELEHRDADVAERLDSVEGLLQEVDGLRARAAATREAIEAIPEQVRHAERAAATARERQSIAAATLADAEHRLAEVSRSRRSNHEAREAAERALRRAKVASSDTEQTVRRMVRSIEDLAASELALRAEGERIEVEAKTLAPVVAAVPRLSDSGTVVPEGTLEGACEWAARAHAALFVVRESLVSERERIVVEAGGLAAAVLGEDVGGTSVALVRRRLERTLAPPG